MTVIAKDPAPGITTGPGFLALTPGLFVVLWSTGFIAAKYGLPDAEPLTFLALRFALVAVLMLIVSLGLGAAWPASWREVGHTALVGILIQATSLGGVFYAIAHGISACTTALIVRLQPLVAASLLDPLLGDAVTAPQRPSLRRGVRSTSH